MKSDDDVDRAGAQASVPDVEELIIEATNADEKGAIEATGLDLPPPRMGNPRPESPKYRRVSVLPLPLGRPNVAVPTKGCHQVRFELRLAYLAGAFTRAMSIHPATETKTKAKYLAFKYLSILLFVSKSRTCMSKTT